MISVLLALTVLAGQPRSGAPPAPVSADTLRAWVAAERYAEAERQAELLVAAIEAEAPVDSLRLGAALDLLVESMWRGGRSTAPGAAERAERAVRLQESLHGPDHPATAHSLHQRANLLRVAARLEGLQPMYERVLEIRLATLGSRHPDVARVLNDFGNYMKLIGGYAEAESLYTRSCATYEELGPEQRRNLGRCSNNLAVLLRVRGRYAEARSLLERALEINQSLLGPDHKNVGLACVNLATVLALTGDHAEARALLERGLQIHERALGPWDADVGWNLRELAAVVVAQGDTVAARRHLERAVAVHERSLGTDHPELALDLVERSRLAATSGDDALAAADLERALAIHERILGAEHPATAADRLELAQLRVREGDLERARALQEQALAIRERSLGHDHPDVAASVADLADTELRLGRHGEAFDLAVRAAATAREHLRITLRTLPERQALALAGEAGRGLDLALSLAIGDTSRTVIARVCDAMIRSRAVVLDEMIQRSHAAVGADLSAEALALATARERLANVLVRGAGTGSAASHRLVLDHARRTKERAERTLAESSLRFRRRERERHAGWDEVRAAIPPRTAVVGYRLYDRTELAPAAPGEPAAPRRVRSYVAAILRGDALAPVLVPLGPAAGIDRQVDAWWREVSRGAALPAWELAPAETRVRAMASALRRAVWDEVASHLDGIERVFVVPDGALHLVHFAALPAGPGYLIESGPVFHYLSAERDVVRSADAAPPGHGMLAIGAPDFDAIPGSGTVAGVPASAGGGSRATVRGEGAECLAVPETFSTLAAAAGEARGACERFRRGPCVPSAGLGCGAGGGAREEAMLLVGADATEAAFKRLAPGRRVLHLATHGFFVDASCSRRAPGHASARSPDIDPTLLGGLAFAGANRHAQMSSDDQDGILTAEEIAGLDLAGVEWTVLSACNTGVGSARAGEGVLGLRRAFEIAGCRRIVMSLWPVRDDAASEWMDALYSARGQDAAQVVHAASRALLARRRARGASTHPYEWAGFVGMGDWRGAPVSGTGP